LDRSANNVLTCFGDVTWIGGVFRIFKPTKLEKIITQTQSRDESVMKKLADAGRPG
jgi:hypothetical protein